MKIAVEKHKGLYEALAAAQMEMGPALKDANNPHFDKKYAALSSVMAACLPALNAHGIAVLQPMIEIDGNRYVKTILAHEGGETAEGLVPLIVQKNDMQGLGSAMTYARRYGLMGMAGIAPEDDDGNAAVAAAPKRNDVAPHKKAAPHINHPAGPSPTDIATASINNAETMDSLAAIFSGLPQSVKSLPEVIGAKDIRKAALQPRYSRAGLSASDSVDDAIPYENEGVAQ